MSVRLAIILACLILLDSDTNTNPGTLTYCYWNLGGLPTDNFAKLYLLEAFLGFGIVVLAETYLTSIVYDDAHEIDSYTIKKYDHPMINKSRGGIAVISKHELTKITESVLFQVKIGNKKCLFTCIYPNPFKVKISSEKMMNLLPN